MYIVLATYHVSSKGPIFVEDVNQSYRHGEHVQEQVRDGQVGDEDVPCAQQCLQWGNLEKNTNRNSWKVKVSCQDLLKWKKTSQANTNRSLLLIRNHFNTFQKVLKL